jgi:fructokinase
MKIISIGEVLWDVIGTTEHLGGAPFNFAAHLAQLGHEVYFVSGVGADKRGDRIIEEMSRRGMSTRYISRIAEHPTGSVTVELSSDGQPSFAIYRPAAYDFPELTQRQLLELSRPTPDWIYFGTLLQTSPQAKRLTETLLDACPAANRFYDVNLRAGSYTDVLVRELLGKADVVKVNDDEVIEIARMVDQSRITLEEFCRLCAKSFDLRSVCVTRGAQGCALLLADEYCEAKGYSVKVADAIGAGDAFAAAFLDAFGRGLPAAKIADFANRVGAIVASKHGAVPDWTTQETSSLT